MQESLVKTFIDGLYGKNTHLEPKKALEGLTETNARKKPADNHSCWENIHHIVVWQEGLIEAIKGNKVDWSEISKNQNWPTEIQLSNSSNFPNLVKKFLNGLSRIEELLRTVNLDKQMPAWDDAPVLQAVIVLLQHNSYHLGQIVAVRKMLDDWSS